MSTIRWCAVCPLLACVLVCVIVGLGLLWLARIIKPL